MDLPKTYKIIKLIVTILTAISDGVLTDEELDNIEKALQGAIGGR